GRRVNRRPTRADRRPTLANRRPTRANRPSTLAHLGPTLANRRPGVRVIWERDASRMSSLEELLALPDDQREIGPFRLVKPLGGSKPRPVWRGEETYGRTRVRTAAVKLFALSSPRDPLRDRITEEARALDGVRHLNVARFYTLAES